MTSKITLFGPEGISLRRSAFRSMIAISIAFVLATGLARAQALMSEIAIREVHGGALQLVGKEWVELKAGDTFSGPSVIRTLKAGGIELKIGNASIVLDSDGAVAINAPAPSTDVLIAQYAGTLMIDCSRRCGSEVIVRTPNVDVSTRDGTFVVTLEAGGTETKVLAGFANATSRVTGQKVALVMGQSAVISKAGKVEIEVRGAGNAYGKEMGNGNGPAPNSSAGGTPGNNGKGPGNNGHGNGSNSPNKGNTSHGNNR